MSTLKTLLNVVRDIVNEVKENGSIVRERIYISRELFEDLALELERIEKFQIQEDQADRYLHMRNFPNGREPNY